MSMCFPAKSMQGLHFSFYKNHVPGPAFSICALVAFPQKEIFADSACGGGDPVHHVTTFSRPSRHGSAHARRPRSTQRMDGPQGELGRPDSPEAQVHPTHTHAHTHNQALHTHALRPARSHAPPPTSARAHTHCFRRSLAAHAPHHTDSHRSSPALPSCLPCCSQSSTRSTPSCPSSLAAAAPSR